MAVEKDEYHWMEHFAELALGLGKIIIVVGSLLVATSSLII